MTTAGERASLLTKAVGILSYSACSSTMLVINKLAVHYFSAPTVVSGLQLAFSVAVVWVLRAAGAITYEPVNATKVKAFITYTATFAGGLYTNIKALELTSVGAVIALRSCLPAVVCVVEWACMGRSLPSAKSGAALLGVLLSAGMYVYSDPKMSSGSGTSFEGIFWLGSWFWLLVFNMTYGKHIADAVPMTQWEKVLYTNLLGIPWTVLLFAVTGEQQSLREVEPSVVAWGWVLGSCVVGVGISYSGWALRDLVSATTFSLVGVLNKMATIAFNLVAFPNDNTGWGVLYLVACIVFGLFYKDPPRNTSGRAGPLFRLLGIGGKGAAMGLGA